MIGLFDSGVGGLAVWREVVRLRPAIRTVYVADQAHVPYGSRPPGEVRRFSEAISRFLVDLGASVVVVACNSASAAALHHLRRVLPRVPFVGMEPAVKPAVSGSRRGVGILATPATFEGELFASLVQRYGAGVPLTSQICPGLVEQVEDGSIDTPRTLALLRRYLDPMLAAGVDSIVLGCTHYSFLHAVIARLAGPAVRIVDPAPAVARQALRVLDGPGVGAGPMPTESARQHRFYTSGDPAALARTLDGLGASSAGIERAYWQESPPLLVASGPGERAAAG